MNIGPSERLEPLPIELEGRFNALSRVTLRRVSRDVESRRHTEIDRLSNVERGVETLMRGSRGGDDIGLRTLNHLHSRDPVVRKKRRVEHTVEMPQTQGAFHTRIQPFQQFVKTIGVNGRYAGPDLGASFMKEIH